MRGAKPRVFVEVGQRFGRLVVQSTDARLGVKPSKPAGWRAAVCLCDCGETITVTISGLVSGKNKSCGCLKQEAPGLQTPEVLAKTRARQTKHGLAVRSGQHPLYNVWYAMMRRCYDADWPGHENWGGRGIRVHEPWHDLRTFVAGMEAEIGPRPEGRHPGGQPLYTIDRIDNDGNYEPGNVRWATATEQQANTRRLPRAECSQDGCPDEAGSRGLCSKHYQRWWRRNRTAA